MCVSRIGRGFLVAGLVAIAMLCRVDFTTAQEAFKQTVLTEDQMARYVAALPEIASIRKATGGKPSRKMQIAFAAVAKKHGFEDYAEFGLLSVTVAQVMTGIDPQTRAFTEPKEVLEEQIRSMTKIIDDLRADIRSEKSQSDRVALTAKLQPLVQMVQDMKDTRPSVPATTTPQNAALVEKYFDRIMKIANGAGDLQ